MGFIDQFAYVEPSLHLWDKAFLIMVYDGFHGFLHTFCKYFMENLCICIHKWSAILFIHWVSMWFSYQSSCGLIKKWAVFPLCPYCEIIWGVSTIIDHWKTGSSLFWIHFTLSFLWLGNFQLLLLFHWEFRTCLNHLFGLD